MATLGSKAKRQLMASSASSLSASCIAQGWLMKQGQIDTAKWRRRWIVLVAHQEMKAVGGTQVLWYDGPDESSADGMFELVAPASADSSQTKNYKVKRYRKVGRAIGLPHCFRVELLRGDSLGLAADTAAIADWWRHAIDSGAVSAPQPPQPTIISLSRVGMVWNTDVELLLCEETLTIRELGVPVMEFRYDAVEGLKHRSGSELALFVKPDHEAHPVLLAGRNAKHAKSTVVQVDSHLDEYARSTGIPWMIERMKQKEADAAACAEERGESQSSEPEPEPESEPEPELALQPASPQVLTLEQILDRGLGGGSGSSRDLLVGTRGAEGSSARSMASISQVALLARTLSRERPLHDQKDLGDSHQRMLHRSTPPGRVCSDFGTVTSLQEIESEFAWMSAGWTIHYPSSSRITEPKSDSGDVGHALEPPSLQIPDHEPDSDSAPPASPVLGMPPDSSAPRPSNCQAVTKEMIDATDCISIGDHRDGWMMVDEQHEQCSELMTLARKGCQTTCARIFNSSKNQLRVTVVKFCDEIKRRAERWQHSHSKARSTEDSTDESTILRDVKAFLEAMNAHVVSEHHQDLHGAVQRALRPRAPLQLVPNKVEEAILVGVEWHIGGFVYSMIQKVLLRDAQTRQTRPGTTTAKDDAELLKRRRLFAEKPQRYLDIDPKLVSPSTWQKPCATLAKVTGATINGKWNSPAAQMDCLVRVAEDIYDTIRVEHPTPAGSKQNIIAADELTPIFVYVVLHTTAKNLCALSELLWNVAPDHLLSGEKGYYLTQLSTALQVLLEDPRLTLDADQEAKARAIEENSVFAAVLANGEKAKAKDTGKQ